MPDVYAVIGAVGGLLGITSTAVNLVIAWRRRNRLDFRVLRVESSVVLYTETEINSVKGGPHPEWEPIVEPGDIRRAFSVIEFSIQNNYPVAVTIGRMEIDGWMYSDQWHPHMYSFPQDYRAFDIHTRKGVDLSSYYVVPKGGALARRVEVLEDTSGPGWTSSKSRYRLPERDQFVIVIHSDVGTITRTIPVEVETVQASQLDAGRIAHWSDLLPERQPDSGPAPKP